MCNVNLISKKLVNLKLLCVVFLLLCSYSRAENANEQGIFVNDTKEGGFIITGWTDAPGQKDIWLMSTDSKGNELWNKTFGNIGIDEEGRSVYQTDEGGYFLINNPGLIKIDSSGNESWNKMSSESLIYGHKMKNASYIILEDLGLKKVDSNGNETWSMNFSAPYAHQGKIVQETNEGDYIVVLDHDLVKIDAIGNEAWDRKFAGWLKSGQQTRDGGYIVVGYKENFGALGDDEFWLIKTDSNGTEQWNRTFGTPGDNWGNSVQQAKDGGYVIAGWSDGIALLVKTDSLGKETWRKSFPGKGMSDGYYVLQTKDGGYIMVGYTRPKAAYGDRTSDLFLVRTDSNGNVKWEKILGLSSHEH
jgi:hypothetical protein